MVTKIRLLGGSLALLTVATVAAPAALDHGGGAGARTIEDMEFHRNVVRRVDSLIGSLGLNAAARYPTIVDVDANTAGVACPEPTETDLDPRLEFTRYEFADRLQTFCASPANTAQAFCDAAISGCRERFPYPGAQGCVLGPTPAGEPSSIAQARNRAKSTLIRRMEMHAGGFLRKLAGEPGEAPTAFANRCCGSVGDAATECRRALAATTLSFVREQEDKINWQGRYGLTEATYDRERGVVNRMMVSEATLSHFMTEQAVEELILHETSHACQFSRAHLNFTPTMSPSQRHDRFDELKFQDARTLSDTRADVLALTGSATFADCLVGSAEAAVAEARARGLEARAAQIAKEIFADAVSALERARSQGDLGQFSIDCARSASDPRHPSGIDTHLRCLFEHQGFKKKMCGSH